jgi:hypothetical protein
MSQTSCAKYKFAPEGSGKDSDGQSCSCFYHVDGSMADAANWTMLPTQNGPQAKVDFTKAMAEGNKAADFRPTRGSREGLAD